MILMILIFVGMCKSQNLLNSSKAETTTSSKPVPPNVGDVCGQSAECISLQRCPELLSKTMAGRRVTDSIEVRQAVCAIRSGFIWVCCSISRQMQTSPVVPPSISENTPEERTLAIEASFLTSNSSTLAIINSDISSSPSPFSTSSPSSTSFTNLQILSTTSLPNPSPTSTSNLSPTNSSNQSHTRSSDLSSIGSTIRPVSSQREDICGLNATCVSLIKCLELHSITIGKILTSLEVSQRVCGIRKRNILVCCRNPSGKESPPSQTHSGESLLPKDCGMTSTGDRLVGGTIAPINAYPWMVAIRYRNIFGNEDFECGASVINSRYLLTAAHCVDQNSLKGKEIIQLNIGDYNIANEGIDCREHNLGKVCSVRSHTTAKPDQIISHPNFSKDTLLNDIALIRIDNELNFTADQNHILPVCLPKEDFSIRSLEPEEMAIAAGWGLTENRTSSNILLHVRIPFADRDLCKRLYRHQFTDAQICAGGDRGIDTCPGDSGGPLMITAKNGPPLTQIGIISIGPKICGLPNFPAVYTDVAKYRQWILANLRP